MEYGPRALGNRSILCHCGGPSVNDWLNTKLNRTEFMPFASMILVEDAKRCYVGIEKSQESAFFMTVTYECTEYMKQTCPAVVHVDGTARPQLVSEESKQSLYRVLNEYEKLSRIPSLINTSFNMHEEPVVCSPTDAIRAFVDSGIDCLAIGPYFVTQLPI
jgi:carbamoyltransferase